MKWLFSSTKKGKKLKIEFCQKNLDRFLKEEDVPLFENFLKNKNVVYKEYECQSHCEICKKHAYALVNGELIKASTSLELLEQLKQE